jgi:hypothetical protein
MRLFDRLNRAAYVNVFELLLLLRSRISSPSLCDEVIVMALLCDLLFRLLFLSLLLSLHFGTLLFLDMRLGCAPYILTFRLPELAPLLAIYS